VTLLVAAMAMVLSMTAAAIFGAVIETASHRGRAQTAADAAALAAISESAPGAAGDHLGQARRFAEANGAVLLSCACEPGQTSALVRVSVHGVRAEARATIDPEAFMAGSPSADTSGLQPRMKEVVDRLLSASGGRIVMVSGWRSREHQERLWQEALLKYGDPEIADNWVARPGTSNHEKGMAVDLDGDMVLAMRLIDELQLPLFRPMSHEVWHFELVGSR
jgi:D-alanyl-D-alanine carboxypeptidase